MTTTTNFGFIIPDGSDNVNLLTQNYPNWSNLDAILKAIKDTGITAATATKTLTNFAVVRSDADCKFFAFVATANYVAGDTFTVDGVPVTATTPAGTALPDGAFVINQSVLACVNGGVLTAFVGGGLSSVDADDVSYDNTVSGLTASDVQAAIDEIASIVAAIPVIRDAGDVSYDNTVSGLTATDVQAAIDELKTLIPTTPTYITTGLTTRTGVNIAAGGYYINNNVCYIDVTIAFVSTMSAQSILVDGWPQGAGGADAVLTPTFNDLAMKNTSASLTKLWAINSVGAGNTRHFIGSYALV